MNNNLEFLGLTQQEVQERIAYGQTNFAKKFTTRTITCILHNNIFTLFNGILVAAIIALILVAANVDALFLATVTCVNVLVGLIEELRAKITLDHLTLLHRRTAKVIRDQTEQIIPIEDIVKDDVIIFASGDQIIADGALLSNNPVYVDESILTGEADTIKKTIGSSLLSGTICISGSGCYKAQQVGKNAYINALTSQAKNYKITRTPIQKDIDRIIEGLTILMIAFIILLSIVGVVKKVPIAHSVLAIVTVIKSLVPQGLVLISTLASALGAIRVAKKKVLVQKLNAIESMSHITTLCLDKTGTIGTNQLKFENLEILSSTYEDVAHKLKLFIGAISDKNKTILAIEEYFAPIKSELLAESPFTSTKKTSAVQILYENTEYYLWLGSPEALTANQLNSTEINKLSDLRQQGLRVLLFASSSKNLAFIVLRDELRPNLIEAIKFYEEHKVALKILSGDHPETIAAIANQTGITKSGTSINGQDLTEVSEQEFNIAVRNGQFFGNLVPQQKQRIVKSLQTSKKFVGMIGDGVNDVLALKQADIGIAMNSGAAAAKDVADIILLKDSFAHLPFLSQEGDLVIYNIKRIAKLFVTKTIYCLLFILLTIFMGMEFPLTPRYITWIDMLTIGIPVTMLTLTTPQLPKQSVQHFFMATIKFALVAGATIAGFAILTYIYCLLWQHQLPLYSKTVSMSVIIAMGLYVVFSVTAKNQRRLILGIIFLSILLFLISIYWHLTRQLLDISFLDISAWIMIAITSAIGIIILNIAKIVTLF